MAVRPFGMFLTSHAGQIVHPTAPAGRPVRAVLPGAIGTQPLVVGYQGWKDPFQPLSIAGFQVIVPFSPGQDVRTGAGRVKAVESILSIFFGDFTADKTIPVLFPVEIIQCFLKVERPSPVSSKTGDKGRIPHEQVAVEGRIAVIGYKIIFGGGAFQIAECQLPGAPIAIDGRRMAGPEWIWKNFAHLGIGG